MATILLISGPNLNLFGQRDPAVYGTDTLEDMVADVAAVLEPAGHQVRHVQSSSEGVIVDAIHDARNDCAAIIINPGAFGHYAYAIADALSMFDGPKIELHVSNPLAREAWRHQSVIAGVVDAGIAGFRRLGYRLAAIAVVEQLGGKSV